MQIKYGIGMNKYKQAYEITKYNNWIEQCQWLYLPKFNAKCYLNNYDKSYTGWYYGAGMLDRICALTIL